MRIRLALPALLLLGCILCGCQEQSSQQTRPGIGIVDITRLLRDSEPGKAGLKFIESLQLETQKQLDDLQARLEKNPTDEAAMQELQQVYANAQQRLQAEGQNVVSILMDTVQRIANEFRKNHGYDMLIGSEAAYSFNPAIDVTNQLMAEINKQKIEFKPMPVEDATQKASDKPSTATPDKKTEESQKQATPSQTGNNTEPGEDPGANKAANTDNKPEPAK